MADSPESILQMVRKIDRGASLLVLLVAFTALLAGRNDVALGIVLGGIASLINFRLLARNARRMRDVKDPRQAARISFAGVGLRFPLMAIALAIALIFPEVFSFAACAAGLFASHVVLVFNGLRVARG